MLFLLLSPYCTNDKSANDSCGSTEPLCYIKCTQGCSWEKVADGFSLKIFSSTAQRISGSKNTDNPGSKDMIRDGDLY